MYKLYISTWLNRPTEVGTAVVLAWQRNPGIHAHWCLSKAYCKVSHTCYRGIQRGKAGFAHRVEPLLLQERQRAQHLQLVIWVGPASQHRSMGAELCSVFLEADNQGHTRTHERSTQRVWRGAYRCAAQLSQESSQLAGRRGSRRELCVSGRMGAR